MSGWVLFVCFVIVIINDHWLFSSHWLKNDVFKLLYYSFFVYYFKQFCKETLPVINFGYGKS